MISIWSPNVKVSGGALIVKLTYENSFLFQFIPQVANGANKKENFNFKDSIFVKFSDDEVGDLLRAIRTNSESKFYHTFKETSTTGSLTHYSIKDDKGNVVKTGFGISVKQGDKSIKVGIGLGAAEKLSEYLKFGLTKVFENSYQEQLKKDKEFAASKKSSQKQESAQSSPQDQGDF